MANQTIPLPVNTMPTDRRHIIKPKPMDLESLVYRPLPGLKDPITEFIERFELPRIHFKPQDGLDYDKVDTVAVTASMVYTEVVGFTLPNACEGVLKWIGQDADAAGLFADCRWRLLINGQVYTDWDDANINTALQRGTIAVPYPATIMLPVASVVSFQVRNTTANTYTARGRLMGWYWTTKGVRYATME